MNSVEKRERLLLRLIHLLTTKFKNQLWLKGGMSLRLYNSPRYTQDVDFVFASKISRRKILTEVKALLESTGDIHISSAEMNSRGVFLDVASEGTLAQIEISVTKKARLNPETMTTAALAAPLKMPAQLVLVMSRPEAFAHKIAACLERKAVRDLYDLTLYEPHTSFDQETLKGRLEKLCVDRRKPISISFAEAGVRLKKRINELKPKDVTEGLKGLVPAHYLAQSYNLITASAGRVCQLLESLA
jgi:predicted nucleotidyltransferase component of viral defense system